MCFMSEPISTHCYVQTAVRGTIVQIIGNNSTYFFQLFERSRSHSLLNLFAVEFIVLSASDGIMVKSVVLGLSIMLRKAILNLPWH